MKTARSVWTPETLVVVLAERTAFPPLLLVTLVACAVTAWVWRFAPSRIVYAIGDDGGSGDPEGVTWPLGTPFEGPSTPGLARSGLSNCHDQQSAGVVAIAICDAHSGRYLVARIREKGESYWKLIGPSATTEAGEITTVRTAIGDVHAMRVTTRLVVHGREAVWDNVFLFGFGPTQKLSVYEPILAGRIAGEPRMVSFRIEITAAGVLTISGNLICAEGIRSDHRESGPLVFP